MRPVSLPLDTLDICFIFLYKYQQMSFTNNEINMLKILSFVIWEIC